MCINRVSQFSVAVVASLLLGACGGGGGGGGGSSSPTPSTVTFPVAQAYSQLIMSGFQVPINISGKVSGVTVSGSGTYGSSPAAAATFKNQAAMSYTESFTGSVTGNGQTVPLNISVKNFIDSNYNYLGSIDNTDGSYTEVDQVVPLPTTVHVNDSGSLSSATDYSDQLKTTVIDTVTATYSVQAETATSVIFVITTKYYDTGHNLTNTDVLSYRITDRGVATWLSDKDTESNGDQLNATAH